jgi:hypothetical protein
MPQVLKERANQFIILGSIAMTIIMGISVTVLYWAAIDTEYPLFAISGKFNGWDQHNPNIARIEWTGERYRYCDAKIGHWFINDGKPVLSYQTERYVSGLHYEGVPGSAETIYDPVEIPPEIRNNLVNPKYRVRFYFSCNYLQRHFPLEVVPPELVIPTGDHSNGP